jgi:hypothetical protein
LSSQWTCVAIALTGAVAKVSAYVDGSGGLEQLAVGADVDATVPVPFEVGGGEGAILALGAVPHRDVRRNLLLLDEPAQEFARAICRVGCQPLTISTPASARLRTATERFRQSSKAVVWLTVLLLAQKREQLAGESIACARYATTAGTARPLRQSSARTALTPPARAQKARARSLAGATATGRDEITKRKLRQIPPPHHCARRPVSSTRSIMCDMWILMVKA